MRSPDQFEDGLRRFVGERAEESRALRAGEKETSELSAIVARYADLFTREQLGVLRDTELASEHVDERERFHRLARACESGIAAAELAPAVDELQTLELAVRVTFRGEELPLRAASSRLGVLSDYADREELGEIVFDASASLNDRRLQLVQASEELSAELSGNPDAIARLEAEKGISLTELALVAGRACERTGETYDELRERWLDRLLGAERASKPASYHAAYVFRLTALADTYTKERATEICVTTLRELGCDISKRPNIRADLEDRPQKAPRPSVVAPDPPRVVHLLTRPMGGLQDYQDFLHEAGHALHYAGSDPALPFTFRALSRDFALTEIFSYLTQSIVQEPRWHSRHFGLSPEKSEESAEVARFLDMFMFRRFLGKLEFELAFWSRFSDDGGTEGGYADSLSTRTGFVYRPDRYLADMDPGFYSADYLRAWIRSAQVRAHLRATAGPGWWHTPSSGAFLDELFREGLRPSSEEIAQRLGFDPLDIEPLVADHERVVAA